MQAVKTYLRSQSGPVPMAYADYLLMTKLWHCTPTEYEQQPEEIIELHINIMNAENRRENKEDKRAEQMEKLSKRMA